MGEWETLHSDIEHRYGTASDGFKDTVDRLGLDHPPALWQALARRGSVRAFDGPPPTRAELELIASLALAAPTKSDLQQRDVIIVDEPPLVSALKAIFADQDWTVGAPSLVVFCGNNRRQRMLHEMRGHEFVNDHLDAFFNASVDAAIVLTAFVLAAEAAGFGTCPISAIRNDADKASEILGLPDHVFPVAGLAVGRPAEAAEPSLRLPLSATVHANRFDETGIGEGIEAYDARRTAVQPYRSQRRRGDLGEAEPYTWSEDKARQYNLPERAGFGTFIRRKGFRLE